MVGELIAVKFDNFNRGVRPGEGVKHPKEPPPGRRRRAAVPEIRHRHSPISLFRFCTNPLRMAM